MMYIRLEDFYMIDMLNKDNHLFITRDSRLGALIISTMMKVGMINLVQHKDRNGHSHILVLD